MFWSGEVIGKWGCTIRFGGNRPPLLAQVSDILIPEWPYSIQRSFTGVSTFKMLRLAVRVRPSARLTRPSVLSGPPAAASPRSGPLSCHHLKRYQSSGPARTLCHGRRVFNSILSNRSWVLRSQAASFSQSMRVYSLPPHQKVRQGLKLLILLWASTSVWLAFFPVEHKRRCWRLTAPVAFHFHCISFNITTNVTSVIIHFHCGICRLLLCSRINEVTQIGKTWGVGVIYTFGGELSNACVAHQCVSSVGVTFKMLKRGCSYIYVTNSVSCQRSFWTCLYETCYLTRQHNSFLVDVLIKLCAQS